MRRTNTTALALLAAAGARAEDTSWYSNYEYGNMFYLGPTTNGAYIVKATYSMAPPSTPCGYATSGGNEELALWIGIQNDPIGVDVLDENFVQPLLNWAPDQESTGCSASETEWCVTASTYSTSGQSSAGYKPVSAGQQLDFEITVDGSVTQTVYLDGEVYSTQTDSSGMQPAVFYGANECYLLSCGTLGSYSWTNISITLSEADASFGDTLTLTNATSDGFTTSDSGLTWTNEKITIAKDYLYMNGDAEQDCESSGSSSGSASSSAAAAKTSAVATTLKTTTAKATTSKGSASKHTSTKASNSQQKSTALWSEPSGFPSDSSGFSSGPAGFEGGNGNNWAAPFGA